jgi:hypothetical protein
MQRRERTPPSERMRGVALIAGTLAVEPKGMM